ncbi:unnamed protein product, partial [marine sediment metagenome]
VPISLVIPIIEDERTSHKIPAEMTMASVIIIPSLRFLPVILALSLLI